MLLKLSVVKGLSADSDNDTSVALNLITDHRPELTKKQLHTMKGFDSCPLVLFLLSSFFSFHLVFSRLSLFSLLVSSLFSSSLFDDVSVLLLCFCCVCLLCFCFVCCCFVGCVASLLCVVVAVAVVVVVVCVVWHAENPMYIQNVPVCNGTTRACIKTCARGAGTHGDVLNVLTKSVSNLHTRTCSMHTLLPSPDTRQHTTRQPHNHNNNNREEKT